jgi:hypothetical protein
VARRPLLLGCVAALLCACGSQAASHLQGTGDGTAPPSSHSSTASLAPGANSAAPQAQGSPMPAATGSAASGGKGAAPGASAAPQATPTIAQYADGTRPAPATATMAAACVTPGGRQSLHLQAPPNYRVAFNAQYSDGGDGARYGGVGQGELDGSGQYSSTWLVAPDAPLGPVTVWIAVSGDDASAFRQPTFTVASHC